MKNVKRIAAILLALACLLSMSGTAFADHLTGGDDWIVNFTAAEKLESNFSAQQIADSVGTLQPGDDITFHVNLKNTNEHTVDWYMSNEVLTTLEETRGVSAADGGYSYLLTYKGPTEELELFNSETVGGDNSEGLLEATDALDEFFYLDTLSVGQEGLVTLVITLDGETQGNSYMMTLADLKMNFAVELDQTHTPEQPTTKPDNPENPTTSPGGSENPTTTPSSGSTTPGTVVRTGDSSSLTIYFVIMGVSGILFLILAIWSIRSRKKERKENL